MVKSIEAMTPKPLKESLQCKKFQVPVSQIMS